MLETNTTDHKFQLTMSATLENIDTADDLAAEYLDKISVPVDLFAVRIMLREALLNAVTHGSGTDPAKTVSIEIENGPEQVTMRVRDSGSGFAWRDRPAYEGNLDESGRGLALMQMYSDNMEFNSTGNELTLQKQFKVDTPISR